MPDIESVVEFQTLELTRLLQDNKRLNRRVDLLIEELSHVRRMQEREQDLRQREQALQLQRETTLASLIDRIPVPIDGPDGEPPRPAPESEHIDGTAIAEPPPPDIPAMPAIPAFLANGSADKPGTGPATDPGAAAPPAQDHRRARPLTDWLALAAGVLG